jgi:hypothetical protein
VSDNNFTFIDSHFGSKSIFDKITNKLISNIVKKQYIAHGYEMELVKTAKALYVWYTSENRRPPLNLEYDLFLSHDLEPYNDRNLYLPFWATKLGNNLSESTRNQKELMLNRKINSVPTNFACAIVSNPEPARMEFIRQLSKIGKVDIYGKLGKELSSKTKLLNKYRFNVCFENSIFPGYVTEKPFESWEYESIPIWSGFDAGNYLNPSAIINVNEFGFRNSLDKISFLEKDFLKSGSRLACISGKRYKNILSSISILGVCNFVFSKNANSSAYFGSVKTKASTAALSAAFNSLSMYDMK